MPVKPLRVNQFNDSPAFIQAKYKQLPKAKVIRDRLPGEATGQTESIWERPVYNPGNWTSARPEADDHLKIKSLPINHASR